MSDEAGLHFLTLSVILSFIYANDKSVSKKAKNKDEIKVSDCGFVQGF